MNTILKRVIVLGYFLLSITLYAQEVNEDSVTKLYVATFDRAPERAGVDYWVESSNLTLEEIATSFFEQEETKVRYPDGYGDENFVDSIYSNLFKRDPDTTGEAYWIEQLKEGSISKSVFILAIINGAVDDDAVILENKTAVGLEFMKSSSDNIKMAYSVMQDIDMTKESVLKAFESIATIEVDGICDNNIKNGCENGDVIGDYETDDSYIWFCQNKNSKISNQCELKKESSSLAECDNSVKNSCVSGLSVGEEQTDEFYFWYCKTEEMLSYQCKISKEPTADAPACNNAIKNGCEVGNETNSSEDNDYYYWNCESGDKVSSLCKIDKEAQEPKCSENEFKCLIGLVDEIAGNYDFQDEFTWKCYTEEESIECSKEKTEKIIDIDAQSETKGKWNSLDCYDYTGESSEQGYLIQFNYREYAGRCASSAEVKTYNTTSFKEATLISTLKKENQQKRTLNFCEEPYQEDANATEYKYEFNTIAKDKCFKTIYR